MNKIITQISVNESHLEFNNRLSKQERGKLVLSNFLTVIDLQFMGNIKAFLTWYDNCRDESLTEYSYTGIHSWKQRGIATIDFDFFVFVAEKLNLPAMSILGYKEQQEEEKLQKPINDAIYIDATNGGYNSTPINEFDTAGWYVIEHQGERKVRQVIRKIKGLELSTNIEEELITDLNSIKFLEKINRFTVDC